jgi:hypothetical protein
LNFFSFFFFKKKRKTPTPLASTLSLAVGLMLWCCVADVVRTHAPPPPRSGLLQLRRIFVDGLRSSGVSHGFEAGAAQLMGNSLREWNRTYDLKFKSRQASDSLRQLQQRRQAMAGADLVRDHLEGTGESDSDVEEEPSRSRSRSPASSGGGGGGSAFSWDEQEPGVPETQQPMLPPPAPKLPQGRQDTGKWRLPVGQAFQSAGEMAGLSLPELQAQFEAVFQVKPTSQNRDWLFTKLVGHKPAPAGKESLWTPGQKRHGSTIVHMPLPEAEFLPLSQAQAMNKPERLAAFKAIYGTVPMSNNKKWLERKISGTCKGLAKRTRGGDYV